MIRAAWWVVGMCACLFACQARADDFGQCTDATYAGYFDDRLSPQDCDTITTADIVWRGGSAKLRAVHPHGMPITGNPALAGRIHELAAAVGTAMDAMGGDMRLGNVTVMFTSYLSPQEDGPDGGFDAGAYTAAAHSVGVPECPVSYYKLNRRAGGDDLVFVLSHEIFHCIQYATWARMPDEGWLTEASAEYFAYLAKSGMGPGYIPNFDAEINGMGMDAMSYEAVPWYLWLGDTEGPQAVRDFVASARGIESIDATQWGDFALAYFDRRIRMPDGRAMPSTPVLGGTIAIHGDDRLRMPPSTPYTIGNAVFAFDRGKVYTLTHAPLPDDARHLWRKAEGGAWGPPLTTVSTCDGPVRYRALWTTTRTRQLGDIVIAAQPATTSLCACPAGRWEETEASLRRYFEQSATGNAAPPRYVSGTRVLALNPDHTGSLTYQDVVTRTEPHDGVWLRQTKRGDTHFTWRTVGGRLLTTYTGHDNRITLHNELHTPGHVTVETREAGAQSIGHAYHCDGDGLHLTQAGDPAAMLQSPEIRPEMRDAMARAFARFSVDMDFVRAGDAPAGTPEPEADGEPEAEPEPEPEPAP